MPLSLVSSLIARFMGPTWGPQDPGEPQVGSMNFAIWVIHTLHALLWFVLVQYGLILPRLVRITSLVWVNLMISPLLTTQPWGKCWFTHQLIGAWDIEITFKWLIFKLTLLIDGWCCYCAIAPKWMSLYLTGDKSTLVQVMTWCRQAASHYLSQYLPSSMTPYIASLGHNELRWKHNRWYVAYSQINFRCANQ